MEDACSKSSRNRIKLGLSSVKGPELLNMYVGQSEQNVRGSWFLPCFFYSMNHHFIHFVSFVFHSC